MSNYMTLENPAMHNVGPTSVRQAQVPGSNPILSGDHIISSDGHWEIEEDIFYDAFPERLKDKAPRVWFDRYWNIGFPDAQAMATGPTAEKIMELGFNEGMWNLDVRLEHMLAEGVAKEIAFPQSIMFYLNSPDVEVRELIFRIYNEYVAKRSAEKPGRFYGVGVLSNWWDPAKAEAAVQQVVDLGLKTYVLPTYPSKARGEELNYGGEEMERLFSCIADAGLPVCLHIAEKTFDVEGRGKFGGLLLSGLQPFRKSFGQMIFGGVFDRNPNLQVAFVEGGLSWVAPALQDAEMMFDSFGAIILEPRPKERPSHYWHNNCYATFQNDMLGLQQLEYLGADRVMWASDYPHAEGTFGYTYSSRESVLNSTTEENALKILGGTAKKVFNL